MQVATLFRESATLLGAQMMESPSSLSCSSSSSAISSIASATGTLSQTSDLSPSSTVNLGPMSDKQSQQQMPSGLGNQNLNMIGGLQDDKRIHEQHQPPPMTQQQHLQQQQMHIQDPNLHQHNMHNHHHLLSNMNQHPPPQLQQQNSQQPHHQHLQQPPPPPPQHTNYRSVLDFIGETKKPDMYHHSHQNNAPHFLDHHKMRNFEEEDDRNYKILPNPSLRSQELNQDDGYETGGAPSDVSNHPPMNTMLPNNYHYMMSSRNMQRPPSNLPKMEYSNDSRHGQTTPSTPGGMSDDPYRFVDDELSSPTQTIVGNSGMENSQPPNQLMPNYMMNADAGSMMNHHSIEQHHNMNNMMRNHVPNDLIMANNNSIIKEPKKRGRKKKLKDEDGNPIETGLPRPIKERKKHDRFNGMSEEEVSQRFLPDHITENLDIVIIGINPGLFAAYKGHHYAGPGNHFWKCLYLSGLTSEQMTADEDFKLIHCGIGFTNMVQRPTKGSADLTRKEIKEGCLTLLEKLRKYQPKIAVFNGKLIYEVFSGKKDFAFGKQAELIEGTRTHMWVMPSSSARCAQLPRAADKVPFYASLKKFRDYLNGHIKDLDESEFVFNDPKLKAICDISLDQLKMENTMMYNNEMNDSNMIDPRCESMHEESHNFSTSKIMEDNVILGNKKKRGRPKKVKGENDELLPKIPRRPVQVCDTDINEDGTQRKKRGRPKKSKQNNNAAIGNDNNFRSKDGSLSLPPMDNINARQIDHRIGIPDNSGGQMNNVSMNQQNGPMHHQNNFRNGNQHHLMHHDQNGLMHHQMAPHLQQHHQHQQHQQQLHMQQHQHHHQLQQQHQQLQQQQQQQQQMLPHLHHSAMHSSTPPMNIRYNTPSRSTPNSNSNASIGPYQNSPQHQNTSAYSQSDLSSEISAAISSDHMTGSPTPSLGPPDFEPPGSLTGENNNSTCHLSVDANVVRVLSRDTSQQQHSQPPPTPSNFHLSHLQTNSLENDATNCRSYSPYRNTNPTGMNFTTDHDQQHLQNQQRPIPTNFGINRNAVPSPLPSHPRPNEIVYKDPQQQQQQQQETSTATTDVASKSLSGLESLVDQIPSIGDHNTVGGTISPNSLNNVSGVTPNSSLTNTTEVENTTTPVTSSASLDSQQFGSNSCLYSSGYSSTDAVISPPTSTTLSSPMLPSHFPMSTTSSSFTPTAPTSLTNTYGSAAPGSIASHFSVSSLASPNYHPSTSAAVAYHSNLINPLAHHHHLSAAGPTLFSVPVSPLYHPHAYPQHTGYPSAYQSTLHMPSPNYPYGYAAANTPYSSAPGTPTYHPMFDRHLKPDIGYGGF